MITVTRLNSKPITVNALLIETIEETPDTMINTYYWQKNYRSRESRHRHPVGAPVLQTIGAVNATLKSNGPEGS